MCIFRGMHDLPEQERLCALMLRCTPLQGIRIEVNGECAVVLFLYHRVSYRTQILLCQLVVESVFEFQHYLSYM